MYAIRSYYEVDLLRPDLVAANFSLGLVGKVKVVDGEVELRSVTMTEKKDFQAAVPMIGRNNFV